MIMIIHTSAPMMIPSVILYIKCNNDDDDVDEKETKNRKDDKIFYEN